MRSVFCDVARRQSNGEEITLVLRTESVTERWRGRLIGWRHTGDNSWWVCQYAVFPVLRYLIQPRRERPSKVD